MANGDDFQKHRSGDAFKQTARFQNALVDTIHRSKANEQNIGRTRKQTFVDHGLIRIKNNTLANRRKFDVVCLVAPVVTPSENEEEFLRAVWMTGIVPTEDLDGAFAILQEPIPDGEFGRALVAGVTPVRLQVEDEDHRWADVKDDDAGVLITGDRGAARILWKDSSGSSSGSGEVWGIVRVSNPDEDEVVLDCIDRIGKLELTSIPNHTGGSELVSGLAIDEHGCLFRISIGDCDDEESSSSGE